jgi:hypothetical protein
MAPSLIRWTPSGPPARCWAVISSPSPERPVHEPPCRCGWSPAARRSRPPGMPNASCTRWESPHPTSCGNGSGSARPASWWLPAPGCASSPAGTWRPLARPRPCAAWPVGAGSSPARPLTTARPSWCWCGPGAPTCSPGLGGPDRGRHRAVRLVAPWPLPPGCRLRHAGRGRPHPRLLGPDRTGSAESLWGPPAQPGPVRRGPGQAPHRPSDPRLRLPTARPGQDQPRNQTLPGPLRRPPALPTPRDPTST